MCVFRKKKRSTVHVLNSNLQLQSYEKNKSEYITEKYVEMREVL